MKKTYYVILICALLTLVVNAQQTSKITVIKAGKLIDTVNAKVLENQLILVENDVIKAVGTNIPIPKDANIIDLSKATVIPGLIDCHVHITAQAGNFNNNNLFIDDSVIAHLYLMPTLLAGFTGVRSLGSDSFDDVYLKRAIERGLLDGPRIQPASFYITSTGGHGDTTPRNPWSSSKYPTEMSGIADGVDEVRKKVRYLVKNGVEVIKIGASAGVLSGEDSVAAPQYSQEEMNALVDEAHLWERKVAAHAHGTQAMKMAIKAGVDSIEHGSLIDDEIIQMMKQKGTYLVADIYNDDYILSEYAKLGFPQQILDKEKLVGKTQRESFQRAVKAGVKIAFGTDAGIFPHGWNGKQFVKHLEWGQTAMQAIQAATINAADLLGWKAKVGSIEVGKFADIIAVSENPIDKISVLENVQFVMKGGKVYKNTLIK
jgi:imidazolonepropionase-like amidohydrolase